ncbi:MAG: dolichyl-phosphate beta-glucosyltransferase [Minisyncoccales bacterium]
MKLSVVIPSYNEAERLPSTLKDIDNYLKKVDYNYEIIVVSDGSTDKTAQKIRELMKEINNLRLIDRKENKGKGYTIRQGLLESKGEYRLFTDADNSTSIDQVEKIWPEFKDGADIVIGSRDIEGAKLVPPQPWWRQRVGDIFNLMVQTTLGLWGIWDTQCGFKAFKKEVVETILPKCRIDGFAFDPEILILARKEDFKIKEIPIEWKNDPDSKVGFSSMFKMGKDLFKIRFNLLTKKYNSK